MKANFDLGTVLLLQQAMQGQYLSAGRLMSPAEVVAATREKGGVPDARMNDWCLSGSLHPGMFALAEKTGLDKYWAQSRHAPSGCSYLLLMQRAGHWEHRFLLPLVGAQIRQCIRDLNTQPLLMSLADGNAGRALIYACGGQGRPMLPGDLVVTDLPKDLPGLSVEIQQMIASLLHPMTAAGPPGCEPARHACVTLVMSGELMAVLESFFERAAGRPTH